MLMYFWAASEVVLFGWQRMDHRNKSFSRFSLLSNKMIHTYKLGQFKFVLKLHKILSSHQVLQSAKP